MRRNIGVCPVQLLDVPPLDIVTLPLKGDEDMATNKERLDDHDARLAQLEIALEIRPPTKTSRLKRWKEWIKSNTWISIPVSIILPVLMLFFGYWLTHHTDWWNHDVDERISSVLKQPSGVGETLHGIEKTVNETKTKIDTLEPFIRDITQHQFENAAKLPTAALGKRLLALRHLVAVAKDQGVKTDAPTLNTLGRNLSNVSLSAPDFWPLAGDFLSYRSQTLLSSFQDLLRSDLPKCADQRPIPMSGIDHHNGKPELVTAFYDDCRVTLDSAEEAVKIFHWFDDRDFAVTFRHCHIIWNGGDIALLTLPLPRETARLPHNGFFLAGLKVVRFDGRWLRFENALFSFNLTSAPPPDGQRFVQRALSQDVPNLQFPPGKPATHS